MYLKLENPDEEFLKENGEPSVPILTFESEWARVQVVKDDRSFVLYQYTYTEREEITGKYVLTYWWPPEVIKEVAKLI